MFHQHFHLGATRAFNLSQTVEARKMLKKLLDTPEDFFEHIKQWVRRLEVIIILTILLSLSCAAATIMRITYGIEVQDRHDPHVAAAELTVQHVSDAFVPGAFLVDILPVGLSEDKSQ